MLVVEVYIRVECSQIPLYRPKFYKRLAGMIFSLTSLTRGVHRTHTPRGMSTGYSAATIDVTSLPSNRCYIAYTVFVYGHIQSVGVTAYRIYTTT